jgi:hypothetical protein
MTRDAEPDPRDRVRERLADRPISRAGVEKVIGPDGIADLRRRYFPRWRPNRVRDASPQLRAYRRVVVADRFEEKLVRALAPADLVVDVVVSPR